MKRIYTALSIAALVLAAGSCEKNLDIPQKSVLSTEDYYTNATAEDAEARQLQRHLRRLRPEDCL